MTDNLHKVSIGLITYNHELFILDCLESIRNQTYKNIEIFISDDRSTDNTAALIQEYNDRHPGLISGFWVQDKNIGISKNCNFLLNKFTGKYGHIFSGDDVMLSQKTEAQVRALNANPDAGLCFSNVEWFWSDTNKKICNHFGFLQKPSTELEDIITDFSIPTPSLMLNLDKVKGIYYHTDLKYVNDFLFVVEVLINARAVYLDQVTVRYRKHKGSLTMQNYFYNDRLLVMELLAQKLPQEYKQSLQGYARIVEYAKIMELIQTGNKSEVFGLLCRILPMAFKSPKWLARLGMVFYKLIKP